MLLRLALMVCAVALCASPNSIDVSGSSPPPGELACIGGGFPSSCQAMEIDVPQFNPTLGTLQSITFDFSATQVIYWGVNDISVPVGDPYTVTVSGSLFTEALPINTQGQEMVSFTSTDSRQISGSPPIFFGNIFSASGSDTSPSDLGAFEGTGSLAVLFTADVSAIVTKQVEGHNAPFAGIHYVQDYGTLNLTYNYTPVPEPRYYGLSILLPIVAVGYRRLRARRSSCVR